LFANNDLFNLTNRDDSLFYLPRLTIFEPSFTSSIDGDANVASGDEPYRGPSSPAGKEQPNAF
jgi:hypothetical protein